MAELSRAIAASLPASKSPATRFRVKVERKDDDVTETRAMVRNTKVDWKPEDISSRIKPHREPRSFINPDGDPRDTGDTGSIPWSIPGSPLMDNSKLQKARAASSLLAFQSGAFKSFGEPLAPADLALMSTLIEVELSIETISQPQVDQSELLDWQPQQINWGELPEVTSSLPAEDSEPLLPDDITSLPVDSTELPISLQPTEPLPNAHTEQPQPVSSSPVDNSKLPDTTPESQVDESEPLEVTNLPVELGEPPVDQSTLQVNTADSLLVVGSEPGVEEEPVAPLPTELTAEQKAELSAVLAAGLAKIKVGEAVVEPAVVEETPHLTREQMGERFGRSHETIRKWEESGKLAALGWELVPGTGTSSKNPRLYRKASTVSS